MRGQLLGDTVRRPVASLSPLCDIHAMYGNGQKECSVYHEP